MPGKLAGCYLVRMIGNLKSPAIALLLVLTTFLIYHGISAEEAVSAGNSDIIQSANTNNASPAAQTLSHTNSNAGDTESPSYTPSPNTVQPADDNYSTEGWGLIKIEAPRARQLSKGGDSIIVAVLDTGIDEDSKDLAERVIAQVNFTNSPTSDDLYGHGTHMAGIIATIAPQCQLMNVKVADDTGKCQASVVARGIAWAVDHGAEVINISLCTESSADLEQAINYAWSQGAVIVAAVGNEGKSAPTYPACYTSCLSVAAIDGNDSLALLSNHGDWVDVAAPGAKIYSTLPQNEYGYKSGTSPAAAHVSGVAALVFNVATDTNGNGTVNDEVREVMENSCSFISADGTGKGCINALNAITEALASG